MPDIRVLVVDDEQSMRELLGIMLRQAGYQVAAADGGEAAIQMLKSESFDLVVTDLRMRKVDGLGVLKAAQALGDFLSLSKRNRRALRVHLGADVQAGLKKLQAAIEKAV